MFDPSAFERATRSSLVGWAQAGRYFLDFAEGVAQVGYQAGVVGEIADCCAGRARTGLKHVNLVPQVVASIG